MKHIIREVAPECTNFNEYFDCDCLDEKSGDYNNTLFIVSNEGYGRYDGLNIEEYKRILKRAESIQEGFTDVEEGITDYDGKTITYKMVMEDEGIEYNPLKCHRLKVWAKDAEITATSDIADFLTIITGEYWTTTSASGYCQGDYVEIVYCAKAYTREQAIICGELWLGAGKEFCVIDCDDDGNEIDSCYGYYVAEQQAWKDEDIKAIVCDNACIDPGETQLELIDGCSTQTIYSYKAM